MCESHSVPNPLALRGPLCILGRMNRPLALACSVIACGLLSGCSLLVASGGKHTERVFVTNASVEAVRKQLGPPTDRVAYPQPTPASEIPEIVSLARYHSGLSLQTPIGLREEYVFNGREYDERDSVSAWALDKSTFGAAEVFMFPFVIDEAWYERGLSHRYTVWYRPDGTYFVHDELTTNPRIQSK
jgi:hypothetical protein